jgi:hypothetical protein
VLSEIWNLDMVGTIWRFSKKGNEGSGSYVMRRFEMPSSSSCWSGGWKGSQWWKFIEDSAGEEMWKRLTTVRWFCMWFEHWIIPGDIGENNSGAVEVWFIAKMVILLHELSEE